MPSPTKPKLENRNEVAGNTDLLSETDSEISTSQSHSAQLFRGPYRLLIDTTCPSQTGEEMAIADTDCVSWLVGVCVCGGGLASASGVRPPICRTHQLRYNEHANRYTRSDP